MEPEKEHLRFYIFTRTQLGELPTKIYEDLQQVYGPSSCSYDTVCRWVRRFKSGKNDVYDDPRCGAPKSAMNEKSIELVKCAIEEDPHITIQELADTHDLSTGTVHTIIHNELHMKKVCAKWVPHLLTEDQKKQRVTCATKMLAMFEPEGPKRLTDIVTGDETYVGFYNMPSKQANMVWIDEAGDRPVVLRPGFHTKKRLFTIFFNYAGPVVVDVLPNKSTMTTKHYTETVLTKVVAAIQEQRPTVGVSRTLLLHDNASCHKARATTSYLEEQQVQVLPHPAYSPDLAPCDFWLFPTIKSRLAGRKFLRVQDLAKAVNSELRGIPVLEYHNAFLQWRERLRRCVENKGGYFE